MDVQEQENPELQKVADLVKDIRFAMLTTEEADGTLRSRPMATVQMDAQGNLWFFTASSSAKVGEAERHHQINLSYMGVDKQDYLSISGMCELVHDKQKMTELWSPWINPWFPDGLDDPDLALLKIAIIHAEYWDSPGSAAMRLYGLVKGMATGNTDALGEHKRVLM